MRGRELKLRGKNVLVLVANPGTTDARVMKESRVLADEGACVHLYCARTPGVPALSEVVDGIHVHRFECYGWPSSSAIAEVRELLPRAINKQVDVYFQQYEALEGRLRTEFVDYWDHLVALRELGTRIREVQSSIDDLTGTKSDGFVDRLLDATLRRGRKRAEAIQLAALQKELPQQRSRVRAIKAKIPERQEYDRVRMQHRDLLYFCRHMLFAANLIEQPLPFEPDVIHVHDLYPLLGGVALKRKLGSRLIYDAHEIEVERTPPLPPEKKGFIEEIEMASLREVDQLITVSHGCEAYYSKKIDRTSIVMNVPDVSLYREEEYSENIRSMAGLDRGAPLIVFTGGIAGVYRGLDKVVEAMAMLPDCHLVVLGPRHKVNDPWLLEVASAFNVVDRVHLLEAVAPEAVPGVIACADLAICPIQDVTLSYRHSMPNKLFEAAYARIPICVSDLPDMATFVRELGIGVVMDQTDPRSIAFSVREVLTNRSKYNPTKKSNDLLGGKYSWDSQRVSILNSYEIVLNCDRVFP